MVETEFIPRVCPIILEIWLRLSIKEQSNSQLGGPCFCAEMWQLSQSNSWEVPFRFLLLCREVNGYRASLCMGSILRCVYTKYSLKGIRFPQGEKNDHKF